MEVIKSMHRWIRIRLRNIQRWVFKKLRQWQLIQKKDERVPLMDPDDREPSIATLVSPKKDYFVQARSWADDLYTTAIVSRNRYKLAFLVSMGLSMLLVIAINMLIPTQHMEPLLINHYSDGRVSVQPLQKLNTVLSPALIESELVRYVINRESYDPSSYPTQYALINLLSSDTVAKQYMSAQSISNRHSPINILGHKGYRTVHVDSVVFLDTAAQNKGKPKAQQTHHNLAQINFTLTDQFKNSTAQKTKAYTALVAWDHQGTPTDPSERWKNWDGFTVTRYTVEQRNV